MNCKCMVRVLAFGWLAVAAASASAITFTEVARFNVSVTSNAQIGPVGEEVPNPAFIGANPSAVAWGGGRLYLAGFNNSAAEANTAIVEVLGATQTGLVAAPTFGTRLGEGDADPFKDSVIPTPASRGYSSLDISADGQSLVAKHDYGSVDAQGLQLFNTNDGTQRWRFTMRGISSAAFDPGYLNQTTQQIEGAGVGTGLNGSGRRWLFDTTTGVQVFDSTNGMIWLPAGDPSTTRDMDFDPVTGDIYVRHDNHLSRAIRNGGNTTSGAPTPPTRIFGDASTQASFVAGQNLAFLSDTSEGDFVIFNDRRGGAAGQVFSNSIKVIQPDGTAVTPSFVTLTDIANGVGYYDFDFDPVTKTLALLDFGNRNVHIFQVGDVATELAGDYNDDGSVDAEDYTVWRDSVGIATALPNDPLGGTVGSAQYDQWAANFGASAPLLVSSAAVPEPATLTIAGLLVAFVAARRRR